VIFSIAITEEESDADEPSLDHYNVSTRKFQETVQFYQDVLGCVNGPGNANAIAPISHPVNRMEGGESGSTSIVGRRQARRTTAALSFHALTEGSRRIGVCATLTRRRRCMPIEVTHRRFRSSYESDRLPGFADAQS
jgi:hypothetical protein